MGYPNSLLPNVSILLSVAVLLSFIIIFIILVDLQNSPKYITDTSYIRSRITHRRTYTTNQQEYMKQNHHNRRNSIEVELDPTVKDLENGKCNLIDARQRRQLAESTNTTTISAGEQLTNINVDYWFAIGVTPGHVLEELDTFLLHQNIYSSITEGNLWCASSDFASEKDQNTTSPLGVITLIPTNLVKSKNLFCQTKSFFPLLSDESSSSIASNNMNCFVMQGTMQIMAQPQSTTNLATYALLKEIQNILTIAATVTGSGQQDVAILSYLGDSAEDAAIFLTELASNTNKPGVGAIEVTNESPSDGTSPVGIAFAIIAPLFIALVLAMFLVKRRKSAIMDGLNQLQTWEEYDPTKNVLKGTGDPPDSYHDGLYHYMNHGRQKYLSTRCKLCLETRHAMHTEMYAAALKCSTSTSTAINKPFHGKEEDDISVSYEISHARSDMKLGQHHMGIDVHVCQSATCPRCSASLEPMFVPTGVIRYPKTMGQLKENSDDDYDDDDDNDNSSISSNETPNSANYSAVDNRSIDTKSTFQRHNVCIPTPTPKRKGYRWFGK